jgi:RNA polymerase sigma-70 factor (ECF subfamily)
MTRKITPIEFDAEQAIQAATATVVGLASSRSLQIQEADRKEIIAQAVAKAWTHRETFNPEKASFRTWVGRITRNCLLDHLKKCRPVEEISEWTGELDMEKAPDVLMMENEGLNRLIEAMSALPEESRKIITFLSEGRKPREIARELNCTPNAASIRCYRARKALKKKLEGEA